MNRRSFLKFLPAGVLGAKHAAAEAAGKLALGGLSGGASLMNAPAQPLSMGVSASYGAKDRALRDMKRLLDPEWLSYRKRSIVVGSLDPDLAMMKSISLGRRIDMQRERNFQREVDRERSYLEKMIAGFFDW